MFVLDRGVYDSPMEEADIEDNDADGLGNSESEDIEKAPKIAKWKLGSW